LNSTRRDKGELGQITPTTWSAPPPRRCRPAPQRGRSPPFPSPVPSVPWFLTKRPRAACFAPIQPGLVRHSGDHSPRQVAQSRAQTPRSTARGRRPLRRRIPPQVVGCRHRYSPAPPLRAAARRRPDGGRTCTRPTHALLSRSVGRPWSPSAIATHGCGNLTRHSASELREGPPCQNEQRRGHGCSPTSATPHSGRSDASWWTPHGPVSFPP